ncbi:mate-domain-containing protein [Lyophyllum atratum]|nr:mate-domain-containing protein [Lyophyllum atratum]
MEYRDVGPSASESTPLLAPTQEVNPDSKEEESRITIFWQEMRTIPKYALPVFASQLLEFSLIVVEVVSVGHISTASLAAASLGSMTASVTGLGMLQGLTSALDTLLPSAFTSPQPELVGLWTQRMTVVVAFALLPIFAIWFEAERILLTLKQDPEIARLAALYLRWFSIGLPAFAFNCVSRRYFQSQGLFSLQNQIILIVAPINVLLNYILVWGPPSTRLGFIGAPIATSISFTLTSILSIVYGVYFAPRIAWHPISSKMFTNLGPLARLGLSGIGQMASEWWAWELIALAASFLGPLTLASQSILITSSATTFPIHILPVKCHDYSRRESSGRKERAKSGCGSKRVDYIFVEVKIVSTIYLVFRNSWAHMFTNDPGEYYPRLQGSISNDGNASITGGILRARGEQFIGALLNISAYYIIGLPLGIWLAFRWGMGLHGLWTGLAVALTYCAVIGTTLCYRTDWDLEVAKVVERLKEEERLRKAVDEENDSLRLTS